MPIVLRALSELAAYSPTNSRTMRHIIILSAVLLAGCSTLNNYGIGGEPRIACYTRDATAILDDKIAGPASAHGSIVRRITDADALCAPLRTNAASAAQ